MAYQPTEIKEIIDAIIRLSLIKDGFDSYNKTTIGVNGIATVLAWRLLGLCITHNIMPSRISNMPYEGGIVFYFNLKNGKSGYADIELYNDGDILATYIPRLREQDWVIRQIKFDNMPTFLNTVKFHSLPASG